MSAAAQLALALAAAAAAAAQSPDHDEPTASALDEAPKLLYAGVLLGWAALLWLALRGGLAAFGLYSLGGCVVWGAVSQFAGGFDGVEMRLLPAPLTRARGGTEEDQELM